MSKIAIMADTTCDLSKELLEKYDIATFPLHIHLGKEEYTDGVDITPKDIVKSIEKLRDKVRASFVADTLTYLHRGGRCSGVAAMAGGALKLHPYISVVNGKLTPGKKYRGRMEKVRYVLFRREVSLQVIVDRERLVFCLLQDVITDNIDDMEEI